MKINEVMTRDIVTCSPSDLVLEVAQSMRALDIGCMPVMDQQRVVGMITDRDIVIRSVALNGQQLVKEVMTKNYFCGTKCFYRRSSRNYGATSNKKITGD
jgi:predicted transcriptional regulator